MIRISGLIAWYLLIADVILGTMMTAGLARVTVPRKAKAALHGLIGWAMIAAIALHVGAVLAFHYHGWGIIDVMDVSFRGTVARNAAVLALWLIVVLDVTAIARQLIDRSTWLILHRTVPFMILLLATLHSVLAGNHGRSLPILIPGVVALSLLLSVFIVRANVTRTRKIHKHAIRKKATT